MCVSHLNGRGFRAFSWSDVYKQWMDKKVFHSFWLFIMYLLKHIHMFVSKSVRIKSKQIQLSTTDFRITNLTLVDPWPQNSNTEVALAVCVLCKYFLFVLALNEKWVGLYFSFCHQNEKCVELSFSHQQCTMFLLLHLHRGVSYVPLRVGFQ